MRLARTRYAAPNVNRREVSAPIGTISHCNLSGGWGHAVAPVTLSRLQPLLSLKPR